MSSISFKTITLYGILVTEESFLTGIHSHVASALNKRVLMKAVGKDVPPELYNEILAHCDEESRVTISKIWSEGFSQSERDLKFGSFQAGSVPALQEIAASGVHVTLVTRNTPFNINGPSDTVAERFVHLSMNSQQPTAQELLEKPSIPMLGGPLLGSVYLGSKGTIDAAAITESATPNNITDSVMFVPDPNALLMATVPEQASRILKLNGIKAAILGWNEDTISAVINKLNLKLVPYDRLKPLEPELVQFQRVFYQ